MNTHNTYISLETAKMLKEAGFDWMCSSLYGMDVRHKGVQIDEDEEYELKSSGRVDEIEYINGGAVYNIYNNNKDPYCYSRPTLDVAQRWLREVKSMHLYVRPILDEHKYVVTVVVDDLTWGQVNDNNGIAKRFNTYEEAQEAGINKCLTILL